MAGTPKPFKLVLLGEAAVGKSSLVLRYMKDEFNESINATLGAAYSTKNVRMPSGGYIAMEIWDTAGSERFQSLAPIYYRGAHAAIIVYDIRRADSFDRAKQWVEQVQAECKEGAVLILAGNKVDLESQREVKTAEAKAYAEANGLLFVETSAKANTNVVGLFESVAERLGQVYKDQIPQPDPQRVDPAAGRSSADGSAARSGGSSGGGSKCCS